MSIFEQVNEGIKTSMKARDKVRLNTLRNIKKVFLEALTAPGASETLDDADALKIIAKLAKQGKDSAREYSEQNRQDLADEELAQVAVIEEFLPKQMTDEEIKAEVESIVKETADESMKDMGKVMGIASKKMAGKADGKKIADIVKAVLSK